MPRSHHDGVLHHADRAFVTSVARADVRATWRAIAGTVTVLAVTLGLALVALSGARRTQSSYSELLRSVNSSTMLVTTFGNYSESTNDAVAALDEVSGSQTNVGFNVGVMVDGRVDRSQLSEAVGTFDGRAFDQDRFVVTSGRMAGRDRVDEIVVNEFAAERFGYAVGRRLDLGVYRSDEFGAPGFFEAPPPASVEMTVTIVGIGLFPDEVIQDEADRTARLLLTPASSELARGLETYGLQGLQLRHGAADVAAVDAQLATMFPPGTIETQRISDLDLDARRALRPISVAIAVFGLIAALVGLALSAQSIARVHRRLGAEHRILHAVGATSASIVLIGMAGPAVTIACGVCAAAGIAIVASATMPIGPVRGLAGVGGVDVDLTVIGLGCAVAILVLLAASIVVVAASAPGRVAQRTRPVRPSWIVTRLASLGLSPSTTTGVRFAVEPNVSGGGVSMRSAMSGAALSVAALIAALTFGSSLAELRSTPRLFGWQWDAVVLAGNGYANLDPAEADTILSAQAGVDEWSGVYFGTDRVDGRLVDLLGLAPGSAVEPPVTAGRAIRDSTEIVLGAETAADLRVGIGDVVTLAGDLAPHPVTVVGIATLPTIGRIHVSHVSLGSGAIVAPELVPGHDRDLFGEYAPGVGPHAYFVRLEPGSDHDAVISAMGRAVLPLAGIAGIDALGVQRPAEIVNARSIIEVPRLLAAVLAIAAALSLAFAVGSSARRRRHELGVLRALGFTGRQLDTAVASQGVTTALVGLVVGVPVGVVLGRALWMQFARDLSVVVRPVVPVGSIGVVVGVTLLIAALVSVTPARSDRQHSVATMIRRQR